MNKTWLEMVFPLSLALLVCTMGVFVLSMLGLLNEQIVSTVEPQEVERVSLPWCGTFDNWQFDSASIVSSNLLPEHEKELLEGSNLFRGNCAQCHAVSEVIVGPALAGIAERRPMSWIIPWVKNSSKMVAKGDEYSVKIFNQYQGQQMPSFQLSDQEIKAIISYVMYSGERSVEKTPCDDFIIVAAVADLKRR